MIRLPYALLRRASARSGSKLFCTLGLSLVTIACTMPNPMYSASSDDGDEDGNGDNAPAADHDGDEDGSGSGAEHGGEDAQPTQEDGPESGPEAEDGDPNPSDSGLETESGEEGPGSESETDGERPEEPAVLIAECNPGRLATNWYGTPIRCALTLEIPDEHSGFDHIYFEMPEGFQALAFRSVESDLEEQSFSTLILDGRTFKLWTERPITEELKLEIVVEVNTPEAANKEARVVVWADGAPPVEGEERPKVEGEEGDADEIERNHNRLVLSVLAPKQNALYFLDNEIDELIVDKWDTVYRIPLGEDEEDPTEIPDADGPEINGIAVDAFRGMLYWTDPESNTIWRRSLLDFDQEIEEVVTALDNPHGIVLDPGREKIYWTERGSEHVYWANYDGAPGLPVVDEHFVGLREIALDRKRSVLYFNQPDADKIWRVSTSGEGLEELSFAETPNYPSSMVLGVHHDDAEDRLYWGDAGSTSDGPGHLIYQRNLDGSEERVIYNPRRPMHPRSLRLDESDPASLYWCDSVFRMIRRVEVKSAGEIETILDLGEWAGRPTSIALGPE